MKPYVDPLDCTIKFLNFLFKTVNIKQLCKSNVFFYLVSFKLNFDLFALQFDHLMWCKYSYNLNRMTVLWSILRRMNIA